MENFITNKNKILFQILHNIIWITPFLTNTKQLQDLQVKSDTTVV